MGARKKPKSDTLLNIEHSTLTRRNSARGLHRPRVFFVLFRFAEGFELLEGLRPEVEKHFFILREDVLFDFD